METNHHQFYYQLHKSQLQNNLLHIASFIITPGFSLLPLLERGFRCRVRRTPHAAAEVTLP